MELTDNLLNVTLSTPIYKDQAVVVSDDSAAAGTAALVSSQGHEYLSFTTGQDGVPAAVNNSTVVASIDATLSDLTVTAGGTEPGDLRVGHPTTRRWWRAPSPR